METTPASKRTRKPKTEPVISRAESKPEPSSAEPVPAPPHAESLRRANQEAIYADTTDHRQSPIGPQTTRRERLCGIDRLRNIMSVSKDVPDDEVCEAAAITLEMIRLQVGWDSGVPSRVEARIYRDGNFPTKWFHRAARRA